MCSISLLIERYFTRSKKKRTNNQRRTKTTEKKMKKRNEINHPPTKQRLLYCSQFTQMECFSYFFLPFFLLSFNSFHSTFRIYIIYGHNNVNESNAQIHLPWFNAKRRRTIFLFLLFVIRLFCFSFGFSIRLHLPIRYSLLFYLNASIESVVCGGIGGGCNFDCIEWP